MQHTTLGKMLGGMLLACSSLSVHGQDGGEVKIFFSEHQSRVLGLSDNGRFAVGAGNDAGRAVYPFYWNLEDNTQEYLRLSPDSDEICAYGDAKDITDDGKIIAGEIDGLPALYFVETAEWKTLPLPAGDYASGWAQKITPDGVYVIGIVLDASGYNGVPCVWKNEELVEIALPEQNLFDEEVTLARFDDISADGSVLVGRQSYNAFPFSSSGFLYKLDTKEFSYIAEDVMLAEAPEIGLLDNHLEDMVLTPDGRKAAGIFYESVYTGDSDKFDFAYLDEYYTSFEYDVEGDVFQSFGVGMRDVAVFAADNNGVLYGATPLGSPIRSAVVIKNGESIPFESYLADNFGIEDILSETGFNTTGTISAVSADGSVIVAMADMAGTNYAVVGGTPSGISKPEASVSVDAFVEDGVLYLKGAVASVKVTDLLGRTVLELSNPSDAVALDNCSGICLVQLTSASGDAVVKKVLVD